ncbi:MAG: metallophosphoesterase [Thermodesulfovibrionales bacterium]
MKIGVISDTHDNMPAIQRAVDVFTSRKVAHVIHAGDYCSPFTFRVLGKLSCGFTGVFGNNDGEKLLLKKMSDGRIHRQPHIFELGGRKIVVMHEHHVAEALAASGHYDAVIFGHTHEPVVRTIGKCLLMNPGEASGWLYGKCTVVIADLAEMTAEIIPF